MKSPKQCLVCYAVAAEEIEIVAHRKRIAAAWNLQVCRSCWRVLEAMFDSAAPGRQLALADENHARSGLAWFW